MKTLIVLLVTVAVSLAAPDGYHFAYAPAPLGHDGRVVDTPEVAHAKAAHLAALAKESARNSLGYGYGSEGAYGAGGHGHAYADIKYHGPPAPLGHDGRVIDTPEVAHAKAAHLHAHAEEAAKSGGHGYGEQVYSPSYSHGYHFAPAPLGHDGRVVDTPEVAHAKAAHFAAYHATAAHVHH